MKISGWGQYPRVDATLHHPTQINKLSSLLARQQPCIPRGQGLSYGDSALFDNVISTAYLDHFLNFDTTRGEITCQAGVRLCDILSVVMPRGWFLPVTPGTQFVTVGGAIASDVHGKNHHAEGCFSDYVKSFDLALASGEVVQCSKTLHPEWFKATCGGMGLTGVITQCTLQLKAIQSSWLDETVIKTRDLDHTFEVFEQHASSTYSVAWIDCLKEGAGMGRSLIMLGEHAAEGGLHVKPQKALSIPVNAPGFVLNPWSMRAFNTLYYNRMRQDTLQRKTYYQPYFYPLDSLRQWNRLYGKDGFMQYQCVIPQACAKEGIRDLLKVITQSQKGSFLAVLKQFGPGNDNYLSFPIAGYTLALDFKMDSSIMPLMDALNARVTDMGGRVYLTKDAVLSEKHFKAQYPSWETFQQVRANMGASRLFQSHQSERLGL